VWKLSDKEDCPSLKWHWALKGRSLILCIDETGDKKKGRTTDYVSRQYISNLGKIDNGIVSVTSYGVLGGITFPIVFEVFKPQARLKATDCYQTKPQMAVQIIRELKALGLDFEVVLADSLYGESSDFVSTLEELELKFVLAIRENHGVWLMPGERVRFSGWKTFDRIFSDGEQEIRYIREVIYGKRRKILYYQITTDPQELPEESTWFVMTTLEGRIQKEVGNVHGMRTWIEYGFKQIKNELGWADFRFTGYAEIEKWWEMVCSAYLMVSLQSGVFKGTEYSGQSQSQPGQEMETSSLKREEVREEETQTQEGQKRFSRHKWWDKAKGWKNVLNNLRLIIQPFVYSCLLSPWLEVFPIPFLKEGFAKLITLMNNFPGFVPV
jgi:DDE superfamily endonuclease